MRKKKCHHNPASKGDQTSLKSHVCSSNATTRASSPGHGRVSEYNPESVLEELSETSPPDLSPDSGRSERHIALFGPPVSIQQSLCASQRLKRQLQWYKKQKYKAPRSKLPSSEQNYLEDSGALLNLPRLTVNSLLSIFVSCLNDLIPVVDGIGLLRDSSNERASRHLLHAVCLVTCKEKQAAPFLYLTSDGPLLAPIDFASQLRRGLEVALHADLEPDKVVKVQILALMHLNNDGNGGCDRASKYLSQAIHEAWSISLHWNIPGNADQEQCDYLWWTLRNFDRLNKPVMAAAPFMIDDTDIGIERIEPRSGIKGHRSQIMSVATILGDLVKSATKVYKATCKARSDDADDFPKFLDLTSEVNFEDFHKMHKCYFEIWYHVAAMLSCRFSGPGTIPYRRRLASADGILGIAFEHGADNLPPLPLIPYAISLSTTMIYRALRDGQRQIDCVRGNLTQCCEVLSTLAPIWTCVRGVEKLARRLLDLLSNPRASTMPSADSTAANGAPNEYIQPMHHDFEKNSLLQRDSDQAVVQSDCQCSGSCQCTPLAVGPEASMQALDETYFPFDTAFHEMFDGGVPNVFRGHGTWEMLNFFDASSPAVATYETFMADETPPSLNFPR